MNKLIKKELKKYEQLVSIELNENLIKEQEQKILKLSGYSSIYQVYINA